MPSQSVASTYPLIILNLAPPMILWTHSSLPPGSKYSSNLGALALGGSQPSNPDTLLEPLPRWMYVAASSPGTLYPSDPFAIPAVGFARINDPDYRTEPCV